MGPLVALAPALAAGGAGVGAAAGGSLLATSLVAATAIAGGLSAYEQIQTGQEVKAEAKAAALREKDAARGDEIERRRALMAVLANRSAVAGAQGVETSGSIGALTRTDIRNNRQDLAVGRVNSAAKQRAFRNQGSNAMRSAKAGAATSLLDSTKSIYQAAG